jgi:UDP-GlcNAc:undecaprenyl-phosphate/decaprenyl-phosphate GlcNAc-1-phosphate transferase
MPVSLLVAALASAAIAALVTSLMVPAVSRLAVALRALDYPGERKVHADPTPRLGGIAIGLGLLFGAGLVSLARWGAWGGRVARSELAAVLLGAAMVFLLGLVDDLVGVSTLHKLLVETAAAAIVAAVGVRFSHLSVPGGQGLGLGILAGVATVVWIVGATNAINLIDGLDGLAGGIAAIISSSLAVYAFVQGYYFTVILLAGMAGACLGFLRHNWEPARIFLGDAGSLTLGFLLAVASVQASIKASAAIAILVPILALGLPVMDTLLVMVVRFFDAPGSRLRTRLLRVGRADLRHVHHLLAEHAHSRRKAVAWLYVATLGFCALAVIVAVTRNIAIGLAVLLVEFVAVLAIRSLGLAGRMRRQAGRRRAELGDLDAESVTGAEPEGRRKPIGVSGSREP